MKKRWITLLMVLLLSLGLYSCGSKDAQPSQEETTEEVTLEKEEEKKQEQKNEKGVSLDQGEILVKIEDLEFKMMDETEVDEDGEKWGYFYYKNNSQYPILYTDVTHEAVKGKEIANYYSDITVMPGGLSPKYRIEIGQGKPVPKLYDYVVYAKGEDYKIIYDADEGNYTQENTKYENQRVPKEEVKVTADQLEIKFNTDPPNSTGEEYSRVSVENRSKYPLILANIRMYSPEKQEDYLFTIEDERAEPGETLAEAYELGAKDLEPLEMRYFVEVEGKVRAYGYNYRLETYAYYGIISSGD